MSSSPPPADAASQAPAAPRMVTCPICKRPAEFSKANRWRPFCTERCKQIDLGAWASDHYRVQTPLRGADGAEEV